MKTSKLVTQVDKHGFERAGFSFELALRERMRPNGRRPCSKIAAASAAEATAA